MNRKLLNLMALNRAAPREYRVVTAKASPGVAAADDEAEIFLYDVIGYDWWSDGGVTAKKFAADLRALGNKTLHLRVNSPGGDVMEGRAMAAALAQYPGKVIAYVDGLAASAASFLIMHADERVMTEGAFVMIHNGWTMTIGDRHDHAAQVALLEKVDTSIVNDYLLHTSADEAQVRAWMDAETWFTATEAKDAGLITSVAESRDQRAQARAKAWNLAAYDHAPDALTAAGDPPEPVAPVEPVAPSEPPAPAGEPPAEPDTGHAARLRALRLVETEPA